MQNVLTQITLRLFERLKEKDAQIAELNGCIDSLSGYPAQTNRPEYLKGYFKQQGQLKHERTN